jgi:gamma-glutamylcyclotransferase (GGCT)/AIG2-like uncharacterized protein YtfP
MNLFVYGTLKKGYGNHHIIADAEFLGTAKTPRNYDIFPVHPAGGFPICVENGKFHVLGELYKINEKILARCDQLESHPDFYRRKLIKLHDGPLDYIYIYPHHYEPSWNGIVQIDPAKFWIGKGKEYEDGPDNSTRQRHETNV